MGQNKAYWTRINPGAFDVEVTPPIALRGLSNPKRLDKLQSWSVRTNCKRSRWPLKLRHPIDASAILLWMSFAGAIFSTKLGVTQQIGSDW